MCDNLIKRTIGHLMARDTEKGEVVWKVRIQDSTSNFNGKKLRVKSFSNNNITLETGLKVTFIIGESVHKGEDILVAVDVSLKINNKRSV